MQTSIKHRIANGWVYYTEKGISIKLFLCWHTIDFLWSEIDFINTVPWVEIQNEEWVCQTYVPKKGASFTEQRRTVQLMADNALEKLSFFHIDVVVKAYTSIRYGSNWLERFLGFMSFPLAKRLLDANDNPTQQAFFEYSVKKKTLNVPLRVLLEFIQQHGRYALLCHF